MEYYIETGNIYEQLVISNINVSHEDYHNGNPYNTTFNVNVTSGGFSGFSKFEYDFKEFILFIKAIKDLCTFKIQIVELKDICYGSEIRFSLDKMGHVNVSGTVYGKAVEHTLIFTFNTDQTALVPFSNALYKDFIKD